MYQRKRYGELGGGRQGVLLSQRLYRARAKAAAFAALGGKCAHCENDDPRVLQIDHVNGGGTQERKHKNPTAMHRYIAQHFERGEYQLLCANCHQIKTFEGTAL